MRSAYNEVKIFNKCLRYVYRVRKAYGLSRVIRVSKQSGTPKLFIFHYSMTDVSGVVDTVKQKVKEQTGVMLECEVLIMK